MHTLSYLIPYLLHNPTQPYIILHNPARYGKVRSVQFPRALTHPPKTKDPKDPRQGPQSKHRNRRLKSEQQHQIPISPNSPRLPPLPFSSFTARLFILYNNPKPQPLFYFLFHTSYYSSLRSSSSLRLAPHISRRLSLRNSSFPPNSSVERSGR